MSSSIVLDYGDYILREPDVALLSSTNWLNDTLIGFYFQYLQLTNDPIPCHFVGPEVTQLLKLISSAEIPSVLSDLVDALATSPYTFFAVNDSTDPSDVCGGSHWSLLIYSQVDKSFIHFDSSGTANHEDAKIITEKLKPYANAPLKNAKMCVQQNNSYDCGCHLLRNAELLLEYVSTKDKPLISECAKTASPQDAAGIRLKLKNLIGNLATKK